MRLEEDWSYLESRVNFLSREFVLELAVRLSHRISGNIIEFGVAQGNSTHVIQKVLRRLERVQVVGQQKKIFACDSFKGLPEKFENAEVGAFACDPPTIRGVEIVEGYFQDSLKPELARRVGKVSFASLDADLFSSTLCALRWLTPLLQTGSILLFDEFLGEKESEKRAFEEWSRETGILTIKIAAFLREPSGWSMQHLDTRTVFQVVQSEELRTRRIVGLGDVRRALQRRLGTFARRLRGGALQVALVGK